MNWLCVRVFYFPSFPFPIGGHFNSIFDMKLKVVLPILTVANIKFSWMAHNRRWKNKELKWNKQRQYNSSIHLLHDPLSFKYHFQLVICDLFYFFFFIFGLAPDFAILRFLLKSLPVLLYYIVFSFFFCSVLRDCSEVDWKWTKNKWKQLSTPMFP